MWNGNSVIAVEDCYMNTLDGKLTLQCYRSPLSISSSVSVVVSLSHLSRPLPPSSTARR